MESEWYQVLKYVYTVSARVRLAITESRHHENPLLRLDLSYLNVPSLLHEPRSTGALCAALRSGVLPNHYSLGIAAGEIATGANRRKNPNPGFGFGKTLPAESLRPGLRDGRKLPRGRDHSLH